MWWIIGIITIVVLVIFLFILKDMLRLKRMRAEIRGAFLEDGLTHGQADKVALYLIDMFIYMKKKKDPGKAQMVIDSTMTMFAMRLHKNKAYKGWSKVKKQIDDIRDACLVLNKPVTETADQLYSSAVSSSEKYMKRNG